MSQSIAQRQGIAKNDTLPKCCKTIGEAQKRYPHVGTDSGNKTIRAGSFAEIPLMHGFNRILLEMGSDRGATFPGTCMRVL